MFSQSRTLLVLHLGIPFFSMLCATFSQETVCSVFAACCIKGREHLALQGLRYDYGELPADVSSESLLADLAGNASVAQSLLSPAWIYASLAAVTWGCLLQ